MKDFIKIVLGATVGAAIVAVAKWYLAPENEFEDELDEDYDDDFAEPDDGDDEILAYNEEEFDELMDSQYEEGYDGGYDAGYADALRELSYIGNNPAALAFQDKLADMEEYYDAKYEGHDNEDVFEDDDAIYGGVETDNVNN